MSQNDVELVYELSPMQEAMLLASLYAPGSGVYVVQLSLRLSGRLDVAAFERAWRLVVERHGVLRTGFYWENLEKPMQVVYGQAGLEIRRESLRGLSAEEQGARLQERLDADREAGFDLGEPPLVRLALFDLGGESWHFVWSQHHLVMDGWSQSHLLAELFACYAAFASGREPSLGRAGSYRDYIAWLQRQDLAAAERFWRQALAGLTSPTLLAGGDGRPAAPSGFQGSRRRQVRLPEETTAALREAGRRHRLTLSTLVQGAWALLLSRGTGQEEVVFGSTVSGRPADLAGAESIVGLFINTLPVRVAVPPERPVLEWLADLQERQAEARHYEHAPLHQVQAWSELPAGIALFDNILVFENYPASEALAGLPPGLTLSRVVTNELTSYPLSLVVVPGAELSLEILYDTGRFEEGAACLLLERLAGLLRGLAGGLLLRLEDLPSLLEGERQGLLVEHNDTQSSYPREASVPALFAAEVASAPQAMAVVGDGEAWSYGRLDEASSRLARHLAALGVEPGARVGLAMERSADLVVGVLGILKAGAAYVPLDPAYPGERLAFMLADAGADLVVVHGRTRERLASLGVRRLCLEADREAIAARSAAPPALRIPAEALAYVIYTSGSTGRPKGVGVPHRAIVRLVREAGYVRLGPGDRTAHAASISFDAATYEIWGALLNGAAMAVIPREVVLAPASLAAALRDQRVTSMFLTSALFAKMAQEAPDAFAGLDELLVGGEAVDPSAARTVLAGRPPRRLLNVYGPTESTTFAAWHVVAEAPPGRAAIPIGLPLANTTLYVLDRWQIPVPAGSPGELWIGGDGLAWGYLNRPELTAERFVPHPWGAGERLYRTGDLVRRLPHRPDGALEFLGRLDDQVKIRGFRIEPGEIEAVLSGHPAVRENAVVARRDAAGEARLVAYIAGHGGRAPQSEELRSWIQERLPGFMVPSSFVTMEALPLTANGKVDRRALPAPELADERHLSGPVDPIDPVTELLAEIWADLLGLERVGIHDDFFALGGHSLLATRVASRIRSVLGAEVPVRSVLEEPTVARLAVVLREGLQDEGMQVPPLLPAPREEDMPLSFAQQRLWFIDQLQPGNPGYNIAMAARLTGDLSVPRLARVFAEVVRRHEVLRTTFASREGRPVQVIAPEPETAPLLPVVDLAGLPRASREALARRLAAAESLWPFDLQRGPLLRLTLVRLGEAEHLLLVTMHHIVSDGWSIGVLLREVQALYRGLSLPELPVQYADYAVWQRRWLAGEALERQLAYWRGQLAGMPGALELPADHPRPAVLSLRGGEIRFVLARELSRRLRELGRREGVTPYMILAGALLALLSRLSGQKDLALGSPIAGRTRLETEGLIGFFVNTLVLRADVGRTEVFLDLLHQVREASLGAYAHQDLPFEKLVDEIQPERDLSRSPLVQVAMALNNLANNIVLPEADLEGLLLTPEDAPAQVAKFDLAFILGDDREGRFAGLLHYATDLYDATTAVRLTRQFTRFLDELTAWPEQPLGDLSYVTEEERQQVLLEWNDTAAVGRPATLLHQLFAERVEAQPEAPAVVWEEEAWSYAELASRARGLARLLVRLGTGRGTPVGVWMERSHHMVAAVLGILEAGGTYVPLDPAWPAERVETILSGMEAPVIVASRATLPAVEAMQWRLPWLGDAVCLDVETPEPEPETFDAASVRALWDLVAERATDRVLDRIRAGGFVSSFTGLPFRDEEVDEYRDRVLSLAAPWLQPGARVLEVGSGAGLILWEMARRVARATGVDPSALVQERNRAHAESAGIGNVDLLVGFAHEIGELFPEGSFDLIVLASTAQFFPGPRYLEKVVSTALGLLAPGGALLVADVPDARREAAFRDALAAAGAPPKQGARELWLDEGLFRDLGGEVLHRVSQTSGFANELGYRYDVLLRKEAASEPRERHKRLWTGWHAGQLLGEPPLPAVASPEDVAYIIHTSGSTGAPKGIAVQHAPAVNLIKWVNRSFGVGPGDRLLFVTSLCFDLSVYDIFGVLAAGGTVHVAPEAALRDPARQVRLLREEPVTIWDSAPAALQQLTPLFSAQVPTGALRLVLLSGDWIPVRLPDQVRAAFPRAGVVALGGATEATVWSNWFPVEEVDPRWPSIPYGRPITEARYHVLDEGMQPCPIGIPGDLYIGGRCLCVGYAGQPGLTAAQFVPDPFAPVEEPGARLYCTGDRSRFFRDGNLEFLGRVDQQVKVRGYRIELGEIEVALLRHPAVREAVVIVREDRPGDRLLAAYVVPREGAAFSAQALRAFLWDRLPSYMVPSAFVTLAALPVTDNGKLDRKALPAPERGRAGVTAAPGAPSDAAADPVEELLSDLFAEVLGLDQVGVRESFFTLGGHSLLATQLMSRVRATLKVEVPLHALFEAPTVAELARVVWTARQEGSALAPPLVPLPPERRQEDLPLSFAQQRLWLIDQLEPGNAAYNIPFAVYLAGEVSVDLLARIFAELIRRHETLRTTFAVRDERPVQVIAPAPAPADTAALPEIAFIDLSDRPEEDREARARDLALEEARLPFDLRRGPLLRLGLVRLEERRHLLLVTMHHIVSDGWSMSVLLREVGTLHAALAPGLPASLPELPVQYADFAVWQRDWLRGAALEAQLDFWKRRLAEAPTVLELPTDHPRPAVQTFSGAALPVALGPVLAERVRELCRERGVTPFMALLAAWSVLLGRHAAQEDVLVGTPVAGRNRREVEDLIGFFINTLVMRADLTGAPSFGVLLERIRDMALDAFAHQDVPFERLVEELVPERDLAVTPLFQVLFVLQNVPGRPLEMPGLVFSPLLVDSGLAKFDLTLTVWEAPEGFLGTLERNTDLFDLATAERLLARFTALLEGAVADPGRAVPDLPLLLPAELDQVLRAHNDTATAYPRESSVPELFEEVARRYPDEPAVVGENGEVWTYRRLDEAANRLARHLWQMGVRVETAVCISMERSPELILGTLAILKAGGVYVPMDPVYPAERLVFMLADTGAEIVLVHERTRDRLAGRGARLVTVDAVDLEGKDAGPLGIRVPAESPAYVIYTSGSTGLPKGVEVPHRGIARLARETNFVHLGPGDRTGQVVSISFDVATYEIWCALLTGAAVVVIPREVVLSSVDFAMLLLEQGVTSMFLTSSLFTKMAAEVPEAFGHMTELLVGGEAVDPAAARTVLLSGNPPRRLLNGYGPTESTTFAAWHWIREVAEGAASVPIGLPLSNTTLYVLDRWQAPVPPRSVGELCIGGDGLAQGYRNRPDLTAERFVPHPFGDAGERLYRTGDLTRHTPEGVIDYLGRLDDQVKIRGFRIEPGEVEAVLSGNPAVKECAVIARTDGRTAPGARKETRLVAYVVGQEDQPPRLEDLRSWIEDRLPDYMMPSAFVLLPALPLTANGKVDRKALPAPERAVTGAGEGFAGAADPVRELLAGIFAEVLELTQIGIHDDFFALGGHSLLVTQVVSRIGQVFGVELALREVFGAPTVAQLARLVHAARAAGLAQAPPIVPVPRGGDDLPLSFAQQRLWVLDQLAPGNVAYNVPAALRLTGEVTAELLVRIFAEVVRRHEALRTTFAERDGRPVQVIAPASSSPIELPVIDLSSLPEAAREALTPTLAREEALRPFDLQRGPLLRLGLLRLGPVDHVLLTTMHHIVADGWSLGVLLREIAALYAAFSQGLPSPLPELPVQYADFAAAQRNWLQGEVLAKQLAYWQHQLAAAPRLLDLPTDRPRPAAQTFRGTVCSAALPSVLSAAIRELCRQQNVTPFMVLLAAWSILLGRHAGQDDLLVGVPVAGRNRWEIEDLIGFFINTLVMRADLSGMPSFAELLGRVRATALDAFTHQDLPFERIVEALALERDLARSPLVQVLFAFQNTPASVLEIPGLTIRSVTPANQSSRFELGLSLWEDPAGFAGFIEHNTDLFDHSTAVRLWEGLAGLLREVTKAPERRPADLSWLSEGERQQVLVEPNDTWSAYPRDASLPELFAAVAREQAEAPAVVAEDGEVWSYGRLDAASNRLARHLAALGVEPGARVGVALERSAELIAALLAIVKAGAAYVPLDPGYPDERLAFLLADTRVAVVLAHRPTRGRLAALSVPRPVRLVCLDAEREEIAAHGSAPLSPTVPTVPAAALAYVIYTSGSTGQPKGVAVPHRAVVGLALGTNGLTLHRDDRLAWNANTGFDAATFEIWGTLLRGATLVVIAQSLLLVPRELAAYLMRQEVTVLHLTTALFNRVVRDEPELLSGLRCALFGGETSDAAAVALALERPPQRLLHMYGPTEGTTFATWYEVRELAPGAATVPIGRPLANTTAYLLDRWGSPVPPGRPGELCLGGERLAWGYLDRPDLTAERFVPDPWSAVPGGRLYRTGDLARRRPDEAFEHLGRLDDQVKIRGFRIEPGEVEAVLSGSPAVKECAVIARTDARDGRKETRLVAYVVGQEDQPPRLEELRSKIQERLPDYMMPSAFVILPALPLKANGKVDRNALPAPEREVTGAGEVLAKSDPVEELVAGILAEVLAIPRVGPHDDFFALGGHSLLAMQVVSRIRQVFGVELALRQFFEALTVAQLSRVVRAARAGGVAPAPPVVPVPRVAALSLSSAQHRLWFVHQLDPDSAAYNIPVSVRIEGPLKVSALAAGLRGIVHRHEALRTTFRMIGGQPSQVISPPGGESLTFVDLCHLPPRLRDGQAARLASWSADSPFDLARGPVFRAMLVGLAEESFLLLLTVHHIALDGWSAAILVRELTGSYQALAAGRQPLLPALPVQYADYARWEQFWMQGEVLAEHLQYWLGKIAGLRTLPYLPGDRPRPAVPTWCAGRSSLTVDPDLAAALRKLGRGEGATLFMTLLTALDALLHLYTGAEDIVTGSGVANRLRPEVEPLIGCFFNLLVLRADLSGRPTFRELLARVRETTLGAYAHQALPFDWLIEALYRGHADRETRIFHMLFELQDSLPGSAALDGLTFTWLDVQTSVVKHDLALYVREQGGGLVGDLAYNADLFSPGWIENFLEDFHRVLEEMAANPDGDIAGIELGAGAVGLQEALEGTLDFE